MEDSWLYIDEDDSSVCSLADSDKIDSETEAELYSRLHHEPNLSFINPGHFNEQSSGLLPYLASKDDVFCMNMQKNESNIDTREHLFLNTNTGNNFSNEKRKSSEMNGDCEIVCGSTKKIKTESMCQGQSINLNSNEFNIINNSSKLTIKDVQDKNTVYVSNNNSNIKKKTVKQESSDSDSDIWIEESSADKSDLKINLLKETDAIFLSSDSDNESDISSPFGKRDSFLRNLSMPNIKTKENPKGLWHINSEDLHRSKKQYNRYHDNFEITCSNCNKKGHTFRTCPIPRVIKCFICGENHTSFRCPKRICSNCHSFGHERKNCERNLFKEFCCVCKMGGHSKVNCPDIWRRYHLTTDPFVLKRGKPVQQSTNLYCWNCGKYGHFGAVCPSSYLSRNSFGTFPCVISYCHPKRLLKKRSSVLKKYSYFRMQNRDRSINNTSNASSENTDHFRPENKLHTPGGSNEENRENKKGRRKFRTAFRFDKVQDIVNGKDFPRTSKKSPNKCSSTPATSEIKTVVPFLLVKNELNKLKKRWNEKSKKQGISEEFPAIDANLPASVKVLADQKFQKWKRNRKRRIKRRLNKACKKEESLQNNDLL